MPNTYSELYVHLIWSTWDRLPMVAKHLQSSVYASIQAECRRLNVEVIAVGGIENHVHRLARLPTTLAVAELAKQVKGASSHLTTHALAPDALFKWQGGYSAFSASKSDVPRVRDYILNQERHHREGTLEDDLE